MATNAIRRSGAYSNMKADGKKSGFTIDPGPYEAIVQGYVKGSRMGQLIVSIPDWSGTILPSDAGESASQLVVSYASPFYGSTYGTDTGINANTPQTAGQTYGFWFVPPDIGNKVLVSFVAGDLNRGYWFACVYDTPSHHMVPANGRNIGGPKNVAQLPAQDGIIGISENSVLPVVEADISDSKIFTTSGLENVSRYPHEIQTKILIHQGLDQDKIRGAISSSSLRETPSNVYGISTPGRSPTKADQVSGNSQAVYFRQGGHSFVMDDGADGTGLDPAGTDQLVRLRTAGGHQILMNDTEEILYIASSTGNQWIEFGNNGEINVYANNGFNLRSTKEINMHSEMAINMCAPVISLTSAASTNVTDTSINLNSAGTLSINAASTGSLNIDGGLTLASISTIDVLSGSDMSLLSSGKTMLRATNTTTITGSAVLIDGNTLSLNCNPSNVSEPITRPQSATLPTLNNLPDTLFDGTNYKNAGTTINSSCTAVPCHEPWATTGGNKIGISRPKLGSL